MQALSNLKMKINSEKIKKINDVNKLDLFERKEKLKQILKNEKERKRKQKTTTTFQFFPMIFELSMFFPTHPFIIFFFSYHMDIVSTKSSKEIKNFKII